MKTKIKEFIEKYRKQIVLVLTLVVFAGILSMSIMSKNNKDEQKDSSINTGEEVGVDKISQNEVFELFKGVTANIEVPQNVLYKNLIKFIEDNNVEGIDELSIGIDSEGIDLSAKYTLLDFIKIPAEFKLVPRVEDSLLKLSIKNIKIMSLKVNLDKIIEKWITANEDIENVVSYQSGEIVIDITKVSPINIKDIKLKEGFLMLSLEINWTLPTLLRWGGGLLC